LITDNDVAAEKPIWGVAGWAKDGKAVLLYDKYDVWSQPLDGSRGTNLTAGAGAAGSTPEMPVITLSGGREPEWGAGA
jgi:hypothetical protein